MLFPGLQRHPVGRASVAVHADPDQPSRHRAPVGIVGGEIGGMGSAEAHRNAEALGVSNGDVRAEFSRWLELGQCEQVRGHDHEAIGGFQLADLLLEVADPAGATGILQQSGKIFAVQERVQIALHDLDAHGLGPGPHHGNGLGKAVAVDKEAAALALAHAPGHHHGLRGGGRLVQHGGVGQTQGREIHDHLLEGDQHFEPGLADFGLVGRVGRIPVRILHDIAPDDRRRDGAVVAHADHGDGGDVCRRDLSRQLVEPVFVQRLRQFEGTAATDRVGHGLIDQFVHGFETQGIEHDGDILGMRPDMASCEIVGPGHVG